MKISYGPGKTEYDPGVLIELTGDEVATAVDAYLVAHGVHVQGPCTVRLNGDTCDTGSVYVDPSGFVITADGEELPGRGPTKETAMTYIQCPRCGYQEASSHPGGERGEAGPFVNCDNCGYDEETAASTKFAAAREERVARAICVALGFTHPDEDWTSTFNGAPLTVTPNIALPPSKTQRWSTFLIAARAAIGAYPS